MKANASIYSINGPVVKTKLAVGFQMLEMVYVGHKQLLGEVIGINDIYTTIQVYESTTGLKIGEPIFKSNSPLGATLGPGILTNIFDGIQRPLKEMAEISGMYVSEGRGLNALNETKLWDITLKVKVGDKVLGGDIFATTPETSLIQHRMMVPNHIKGTVSFTIENGSYNINEILIIVTDEYGIQHSLSSVQKWPIRQARPVGKRQIISVPLITGQRVIDTFFPIAKGGAAAVPGGFGAGKTMTQHQLAKWCDADIIVYVGCGERGNEMTQVLEEFSELVDPKSHKPLTDRTVLIANTSNMPVAAREASIYTGITLAEYYRDMGYHVALMADSTSRWAEALREISGRLEEMPAEEGFPAYLPSRISQFYERAGYVENINHTEGSVTIIGAVSPQGADFSEPVTQNTKRFVRAFWALDKSLAYARHFPAINWNISYSEYMDDLRKWYDTNVDRKFVGLRAEMMSILHEETQLMEIVKLIGSDVLPDDQKLILEIARVIRVGYLQQNAFHPEDTFVPFEKQFKMLQLISYLKAQSVRLLSTKRTIRAITATGIFDELIKIKYDVKNNEIEKLDTYYEKIDLALASVK
ncbi:MAG: V-type H+-transporting ATPase subunit A [Erysipelotrichaceae bacterium]|nr:MAG: V-type H+-transporting ATPase subunit [Erysipelotrichaceae bacterium]TXT19738.1 MAG: V-type H+-transporting ATPase subunit A [Erysipelotrichaceae bacterium]